MLGLKVVKCSSEGLSQCAAVLDQGGVVVFPTDTVYGIGCNPFDADAVERIFEVKRIDEKKPLPVLVGNQLDAEKLVDLGSTGKLLAHAYWPGPLTMVAPLLENSIAPQVSAGTGKLAVRVPADECILSLLKLCKFLVGTSANLAGHASPKSADEVLNSGLEGYDLLLDGGAAKRGRESTIFDLTSLIITREAAISATEIFKLVGAANR
jgi:L-threonylcarbamoyladenylate synthase